MLSALNSRYGDFLYDEADECESFVGHFVDNQLENLWSDYDKKNWSRCDGMFNFGILGNYVWFGWEVSLKQLSK